MTWWEYMLAGWVALNALLFLLAILDWRDERRLAEECHQRFLAEWRLEWPT